MRTGPLRAAPNSSRAVLFARATASVTAASSSRASASRTAATAPAHLWSFSALISSASTMAMWVAACTFR